MRAALASFDQHYREQVHSLENVPLIVREPAEACGVCRGRMEVQKTIQRTGRTLAHGSFRVRETIYVCSSRCHKKGRLVTTHSSLAQLLLPHCTVGYDVLVYVGCQRFLHYRQREEIRTDLEKRYGIVLSTGEISALARRFLVYLEALHWKRAPALRAALEADGGWPLHIDATGEDGRGTMVTAWAGWRGWVLSAWKAPTERAEYILPGILRVAADFGDPCAILRDLGRAMTEAATEYVQSLKKPIPVLACHQHFLDDIGGDLLEDGHNQLRDCFRKIRLLPRLRAFVRQQGRHLGESITLGREAVKCWFKKKRPRSAASGRCRWNHDCPELGPVGIGLSRRWLRSGFSLRSSLAQSLRPLPPALGRHPHFPRPPPGRCSSPQITRDSPAHASSPAGK